MADEGGKGGLVTKVVATVFGAVIAPILVTVGVKYIGGKDDPKPDPPVVQAKAERDQLASADKEKAKPVLADSVLHMVDPDLGQWWYVYEHKTGKEAGAAPYQLAKPKDVGAIFAFDIHEGALHSPGGKIGALVSKEQTYNYHLTVEYKWGPVPPPSPGDKPSPRRSGFVVHAQDTTAQRPFMPGIGCLIVPGNAGALSLRGADVSVKAAVAEKVEWVHDKVEPVKPPVKETTDVFKLTKEKGAGKAARDKGDLAKMPKDKGEAAKTKDKSDLAKKGPREVIRHDYKPGAPVKLIASDVKHWGLIHRLGNDPTLGEDDDPVVGKDDLEKTGDWNKLECICDGDTITVRLNGKEVNACTSVSPRRGRIVVLADGSNIFFRRIDLEPLKK